MKISPEILKILVCPESHQPLRPVDSETLAEMNRKIEQGTVKNVSGKVVSEAVENGLLREDGKILYPIKNEIPVLLAGEGILL